MLRNVATFAVVVVLGIVAARLIAERGYGLPWPARPAASAPITPALGRPGPSPFPTGPSAEEVTQREMASCASPLSSATVRITSCTVAIQSGGLSENNRAVAFCNRGTGHEMKHEAALAAADFDEAVRIGPGSAAGYLCRGHAELARGAVDEAIADYGRSIEAAPDRYQAYVGLGNAQMRRNDVDLAVSEYTKSIVLDDHDPSSFVDRGAAYVKLQRFPLAVADFAQALELDPQNTGALVGRADARMRTADWAPAVADLDAALRFEPGDVDAIRLRGYCRYRQGDYAGAITDGQQALKLDPHAPVNYLDASRARSPGPHPNRSIR